MQTILGAGGAIGTALAKVLPEYTPQIRLVGRSPEKVNETDVLFAGDLTQAGVAEKAVEGAEVAYLTVGLPYDAKLWQHSWPLIMENVIRACLKHGSKLVFFDNIYLYEGTHLDPITEDTKVHPLTKKGKVRAKICRMLWEAVEKQGLTALIARCGDFYGPGVQGSGILRETIIKPLSKGDTANLFAADGYKHSYTYVPDAAKATALLGNTPDTYGAVWHLPTAGNPPTGKQWVEMVAKALDTRPKYRIINKMLARLIGFFVPEIRESVEMFYQYNRDYVFDSSKFEQRFDFVPTPYQQGIKAVVALDFPEHGTSAAAPAPRV